MTYKKDRKIVRRGWYILLFCAPFLFIWPINVFLAIPYCVFFGYVLNIAVNSNKNIPLKISSAEIQSNLPKMINLLKRNALLLIAAIAFLPSIINSGITQKVFGITTKFTDGSKFYFRSENTYCEWKGSEENRRLRCTANGVRTYLNGVRENYSDTRFCSRTVYGKEADPADWWRNPGPDSYVCRAARKFGKY